MKTPAMPRVDYEAYIVSEAWQAFKRRYAAAGWPVTCLICESLKVTYHHTTYERLGREEFRDVAPMCWGCHERLHEEHEHAGRGGPDGFVKQAVKVFGIDESVLLFRMLKWFPKRLRGRKKPPLQKHKKPKQKGKKDKKVRREKAGDLIRVACPQCGHRVQRRAIIDFGMCFPCHDKKKAGVTVPDIFKNSKCRVCGRPLPRCPTQTCTACLDGG